MKKFISLIISLVLVFSVVSTASFAATPTTEKSFAPVAEAHITRSWDNENQAYTYSVSDISSVTGTKNIYGPVKLDGNTYAEGKTDRSYLAFKLDLTEMENIAKATLSISASKIDNGGEMKAYAVDGTWEQVLNPETLPAFGKEIGSVFSSRIDSAVTRTVDITGYIAEKKEAGATEAIIYVTYIGTTVRPNYNGGFRSYALGAAKAPTLTISEYVEGIGTKLLSHVSETVYFTGEGEIGYVGKDTATGEALEGNQAIGAGDYVLSTNADKNMDSILYLRKDLSAFADKDIVKIEFQVYNRQHRSGAKTFIARTDATWVADGENEISYANQPAVDSAVSEIVFKGSSSANATTTADITSLTADLQTAHNNVLSLRFRSNVYEAKDEKAATFYKVGQEGGAALVITYLEETDEIKDSVTFKAELDNDGAKVKLFVGIYDVNGNLMAIKCSDVLTVGTDALVLPVDLTAYPEAASIKGFFWNGDGIKPYMEITPANVAVSS